jgi:hypothetical protein
MTIEDIKIWIKTNLFNRSGYLSSERTRKKWFENRKLLELYEQVIDLTSFLSEDVLFSERIFCVLRNIVSPVLCKKEGCSNRVGFKRFSRGYHDYCSPSHAVSDEVTQEKIKSTIRNKYGHDFVFLVPSVQEKIKKTNFERHGAENYAQSIFFKNKNIESNIARYGTPNHSQISFTTEQLSLLNDREFLLNEHAVNKKTISRIAHELGVCESTVSNRFRKLDIDTIMFPVSEGEKEIADFIGDCNILTNKRSIVPPKELDIYLPDYKLAIEFNGNYWHSVYCPKYYHLMKTEMCEEKGIQLLHVFQSEWENPIKQNIWKSLTNGILGRNTEVHPDNVKEVVDVRTFLEENHLEGFTESKVNLGLYSEGELISLACFSDGFLVRFCDKVGFDVPRSLETLLQAYNQEVVYLANRRWNSFPGLLCTEPSQFVDSHGHINWDSGSWICEWEGVENDLS